MRKILFIVLAVAVALLLCAGCNNSSRTDDDDLDEGLGVIVIGGASDDDTDDDSDDDSNVDDSNVDDDKPGSDTPEEWPFDELPTGFPVYPNGEPSCTINTAGVHIYIYNTDRDACERYMDDLKAWGFEFGEPQSDGECKGYTEDWTISINFDASQRRAKLLLADSDTAPGRPGWPADELPTGFPVYPSGDPIFILDEAGVFLNIYNTDRNTFEGYLDALKAWGFEFNDPTSNGVYVGYTENWAIAIFHEDDYNHTYFGLEPDIGG